MAIREITQPYGIYIDRDGNHLEDGYIYVGVGGLPAETNPIQVYWDAAATIPAAQPIRTNNGIPVRNGAPAKFYVNGDYSFLVLDKNRELVFSATNLQEDPTFIGYDPIDDRIEAEKDLYVNGNTETESLNVNGNTVLGDTATDTVSFVARIASALVATGSGAYDLGTAAVRWGNAYLTGSLFADTVSANHGDFAVDVTSPSFSNDVGDTVIDAPAGLDTIIKTDGVEKARVTSDGDVIAARYSNPAQNPYFTAQWTGVGGTDEVIADNSANIAIAALNEIDPGNHFDRLTGEYTAPNSGLYAFHWKWRIAGLGIIDRELRLQVDTGGGFSTVHILQLERGNDYTDSISTTYPISLSAGDKVRLQISGGSMRNELDSTLFAGWLI